MTMAAPDDNPEAARPVFRSLRELAESIRARAEEKGFSVGRELSRGMTSDYEVAIEEGATIVRIGSAIFGYRG